MKRTLMVLALVLGWAALVGCQSIPPSDMTLDRGAQLLAAGSPKSAIPFLTQTVAATPDGPEPIALLALAYALDCQPERALAQAQLVHRAKGEAPGWEVLAVGIAHLSAGRYQEALVPLRQAAEQTPATARNQAALQWLALDQLLANQPEAALGTLKALGQNPALQPTALLWTVLIQAARNDTGAASAALVVCAKLLTPASRLPITNYQLPKTVDDQTLYDAALAALANNDLPASTRLFKLVVDHDPEASDAPVWLALLATAREPWAAARAQLSERVETTPHFASR